MFNNPILQNRLKELKLELQVGERDFNDLRERLKSAKKHITDTRGAILEVENLLKLPKN